VFQFSGSGWTSPKRDADLSDDDGEPVRDARLVAGRATVRNVMRAGAPRRMITGKGGQKKRHARRRTTAHDHRKRWSEDSVGELPFAAQIEQR
jgi:hypothetical protein